MFITDAPVGLMKYRTMLIKKKREKNKWGYTKPLPRPIERESGVGAEIRNRPSSIHTALKPSSAKKVRSNSNWPGQGPLQPSFYFQTHHAKFQQAIWELLWKGKQKREPNCLYHSVWPL